MTKCEETNNTLDKDKAALMDEMNNVHKEKEEKLKTIKEKSKKWEALQRQKDEATATFDEVRKQDELLHAELVETNKRRKANMMSAKTVIFNFIILTSNLHINYKY